MKKKYLVVLIGIVLMGVGSLGYVFFYQPVEALTYNDFLKAVAEEQVYSVTIDENEQWFYATIGEENQEYKIAHPKTENFTEYLLLNDIDISYGGTSWVIRMLQIMVFVVIGTWIYLWSRNGGANKRLIVNANGKKGDSTTITLENVAGNIEAKAMVKDIIQFIKQPEKYGQVGAKMPRGILFYGPPGTGKTLMAKAIAGEAHVPFYAMSGSDFVQMYVGVGASRIRSLFQKAKKSEKAVIFIDEIDAIGKKRGRHLSASNDERDQTLNALLTEMSGFSENKGIIVIGATNRLDTLDDALLRPGRFDRQIEIGLPDINARKKIIELHSQEKPIAEDVDFEHLAKSTVYFSGAMLENLLNEAAIYAANEGKSYIGAQHIDKAFYTVIAGAQKQDRSYISEKDRKITAYHEAGHALLTHLLLPEHHISKVTIIPSVRGAGGFNLSIPKDALYQTQKQIKANIQVLLAGRAAEELTFGSEEITTGASNDIQKASRLMLDYMNKFGMDRELGLFTTEGLEGYQDKEVILKCREEMNLLYDQTQEILRSYQHLLEKIAKELLEKESIDGTDIKRLAG